MIYRLKLGSPFETEAVVDYSEVIDKKENDFIELLGNLKCALRYGKDLASENEVKLEFSYKMHENTSIYGLGESNRGINKRGYIYVSDNTDDPHHTEEKKSLYGAHNFIVFKDFDEDFGLFFDYPGKITFDLGYSSTSLARITAETDDMYIYLITGSSVKDIVKSFRGIIGKSYIAPSWAFGFQQSRWGYRDEADIRQVVNAYREAGIPLDAVYLDIDYMEDYKDFTVDGDRFPFFQDFVQEMKDQGIHLVPIIDAGVKIEDGYDVYEEGKNRGYFCVNEDSAPFSVGVWPGWTHMPDFIRPEVREWFGGLYENLTRYGIDGFWNDMNEPAMFYSEKCVENTISAVKDVCVFDREPTVEDCQRIRDLVDDWTSHSHYKDFYSIYNGKRIRHDKIHNLYGYNMTRAAAEGLEKIMPNERVLLFSRSSYIGMHRYAGIWTGDNQSWWSHLLMNLQMLPSLNMCGFLYSGADIGGFGSDTTEDLLLRWVALGIFTPLFRNHSCLGTRLQECYRFENVDAFKEIISLRYRLLPYLYSEYLKSVENNDMLFRPLAFDYEDDVDAIAIDDQLMLGESLMIAPVYKQNAIGRMVYIPEEMDMILFTSAHEYTVTPMTVGYHFIKVALTEVVIFLRKGHILPLGCAEVCTADLRRYNDAGKRGELRRTDFEIIGDESCEYQMWTDYDLASESRDFNISVI